jgi:hypothetical protein
VLPARCVNVGRRLLPPIPASGASAEIGSCALACLRSSPAAPSRSPQGTSCGTVSAPAATRRSLRRQSDSPWSRPAATAGRAPCLRTIFPCLPEIDGPANSRALSQSPKRGSDTRLAVPEQSRPCEPGWVAAARQSGSARPGRRGGSAARAPAHAAWPAARFRARGRR